MLWTEKHRPAVLAEIKGQDRIVAILSSCASAKTLPHLMLTGPHGTGKSAAIRCFARELYGENYETNTTIFQTSDLFSQGKKLLEEDERYAHLYQKGQSLIVNFKHILKWYASIRPLDADFKLMVFEDAHALTRDAQQGLRRIMERYSGTCRFVFTTTNPSAIIPAISSRCLPLFFAPIPADLMIGHLREIAGQEQAGTRVSCTEDDLELIAAAAKGDLRRAILMLQVASETGSCSNLAALSQSETATVASSALRLIQSGDVQSGIRQLESLMIDYGLSGREVLAEIREAAHRDYNHPALARALAAADARLGHANSEYIQIDAFATGIREIFS
ncbi:AAA family ATPase [Methanoregula sp. UBA64]|jgi:replication factor C small subunit|uniref:AAA family ATPase n=1 Tax=Methanoregula sp. UBA64 TaxID=1915554 RepID=UPI0025FA6592|nr:AAA family ATPase [Methanoregula sp. UBA64]